MNPRKVYCAAYNAVRRCHDPHHPQWANYGGRGITVHEPWRTDLVAFQVYLEQLPGFDDHSLTIDRIDNTRGYEPGNLRWASRKQQANNKRPPPRTQLAIARAKFPVGTRFGANEVIGHAERVSSGRGVATVVLRCSCGNERIVNYGGLSKRQPESCITCYRATKLAAMGRTYAGVPTAGRRKPLDTDPPTA